MRSVVKIVEYTNYFGVYKIMYIRYFYSWLCKNVAIERKNIHELSFQHIWYNFWGIVLLRPYEIFHRQRDIKKYMSLKIIIKKIFQLNILFKSRFNNYQMWNFKFRIIFLDIIISLQLSSGAEFRYYNYVLMTNINYLHYMESMKDDLEYVNHTKKNHLTFNFFITRLILKQS